MSIELNDLVQIEFNVEYALELLIPFLIYLTSIVIYSIFIFHFYRYLARRDIFKLDLKKYDKSNFNFIRKLTSFYLYILKYFLLFPIFVSFWSLFLASLIIFMSNSQNIQNTILISVVLVSAIRITAYYKEDLSKDLAKMLPFALLGVFIMDINFFSLETAVAGVVEIPSFYLTLVYYFIFTIVLEISLRMGHGLACIFKKSEN